jgi:hypothetical protein
MGVPATTGVERTKVSDMQIGDYISCKYAAASGATGTFSELGVSTATEIPATGASAPNGTFYYVKTAKGLLIADRVVQHTRSWDSLNASKEIQGLPWTGSDVNQPAGIIRSLTGGVAYADAQGNKSLSDASNGAWPTNNEWDRHIVGFPADKIQAGKTLEDVWHWGSVASWCQDTPVDGVILSGSNSVNRIGRGYDRADQIHVDSSSKSATTWGFRPVFEYDE